MTIATADTTAPAVDAAQPWPGLDAFTEELSRFFCGRDTETDELFRHTQRDVVTVLFGQSGLGKTSLLQAGLFPRMRKAGFLPILIRLDYSAEAPSPVTQIKAGIERECTAPGLHEVTWSTAEETLWGCFHRADRRLIDHAGKEVVPVLVFDQFEEIFTQGLARSESRAAGQRFLTELAELLENRPPNALEQAIEADPEIAEDFLFDRRDYRIVLALREDFLAALEGLRARAPSLGRNRYRLRRMTGAQGLNAILNPVPGLVDYDVAQEIIRFVGRANPEYAFGAISAGDAAEGFEVEPSLLSLVCRELNERRLALGLDEISADLLAGNRDKIIEEFYERCLAGQLAPLRAFVEDELLSASGFRESVTLDTAQRVLNDSGVPAATLDELVKRRLLHIEERSDIPRVEIIHDVLTPVIRRSRDTRRLREAEAAAADREAALHRERQRVRRAHWFAAAMTLLAIATIGLFLWGWSSKLEEEHQHALAEQQRAAAEKQAHIAEEQRAAAAAERTRAEQNLDTAVDTADTMVTTVAERLRDLTGVPTATIRDILKSAEGAFERIAAAAPNSLHLRWRRAVMLVAFAHTYQTLGDSGKALRRARDGSNIMLALVKENPQNDQWQADLALSSRVTGEILCNGVDYLCLGDLSQALVAYRGDLGIMATLVAKDPENVDWQSELARAHFGVGQVLEAQGGLADAITEYRAALDIDQRLIKKDSSNARWRRDLGIGHQKVGNVLVNQGDLADALAEYRTGLEIARGLADADPSNTRWQRDLSISHEKLGEVLRAQGDLVGALAEYRTNLEIGERLAEKDPGNTQWQNDVSVDQQLIGDILIAQGKLPAALAEYRAALDTSKRLTEKDLDNEKWQKNLAAFHDRVGNVLRAQGDLAGALAEYRADLEIVQRLAEKDPDNTEWQRDVSISHEKIGNALLDQGNLAAALAEYRAKLDIVQRLVKVDPDNALWQRSLLISYGKTGLVAYQRNDFPAALDAFEKAEEIALHVAEMNPTAATSTTDLAWVRALLDETHRKITGSSAAGNRKK